MPSFSGEASTEGDAKKGEQQRLEALRRYALLDASPEPAFDRLTGLARRVFDTPIALVSLVGEDRLWFKSALGIEQRETPRAASFCASNIERGAVMVVEDAVQEDRFDENPLVHGEESSLRFYAGAPLTTHDGYHLGAFCVLDHEPRAFDDEDKSALTDLAAMAMEEIELRLSLPRGGEAMYDDRALLSSIVGLQDEVANATLSLKETANLVVQRARLITGADGVCLTEWSNAGEAGSERAAVYAAAGLCEAEALSGPRLHPEEQALCREALRSGEAVYVEDAQDDPRAAVLSQEEGIRSVLVTPLRSGGEVLGTLELLSRRPGAFEARHVQTIDLLLGPIEAALERTRAEEALRESERRHRSLLEHLPVGVYRSTPDGVLVEANSGLADILGYETPDALLQKSAEDLYVDLEDRARHVGQLAAGETRAGEFQLRGADGRVVWVRDYPRAVTDASGAVQYFDGVVVDVTERKEAEDQVVESEARLRAIVENVSDMIEVVKADGTVLHVSGDVEGITGYTPEEVVGRPYYMNAHPDDRERVKGELPYLLEHRTETVEFEYRFRHPSGDWRHLSVRGGNFPDESEGSAFLGIVRDITERRRAEQDHAASESRLRGIVENIADVIEVIDEDGTLRYASGSIRALTGFGAEAIEGQSLFDRMHPDDLPEAKRKFQALLDRPEEVQEHEYRFRHRDGGWRYLSTRLRNFLDRPGIDGILGTARDVTEKKEFEEKLVEAKEEAEELARLKSIFLANMSHEIRTPLASILGFAEVLVEEAEGEMSEFAELIQQGGERLSDTLDSVLDLARLEAGGFEPDLQALSLGALARDAAALYAPMAESKGLTFHLDVPEDGDARLLADRAATDRIFANLLSNAIKFTEEGSVTLTGRRLDNAVEVGVADTGTGMEPGFREHLFEAFRQESSGLTRLYEGTGLGLAITRRLAEVMNVDIEVETQKGEGSTFRLRFPVPQQEAAPAPTPEEPPPAAETNLGTLLAVEDNEDTRVLLERFLRKNWTPTVVADPHEALRAAAETAFDAVLLDINLGSDLDGVDVMKRLREDDRYAEVPFVALTAYAMPGDAENFTDVGFDAYVSKPFTHKRLMQVLRDLSEGALEETPGNASPG